MQKKEKGIEPSPPDSIVDAEPLSFWSILLREMTQSIIISTVAFGITYNSKKELIQITIHSSCLAWCGLSKWDPLQVSIESSFWFFKAVLYSPNRAWLHSWIELGSISEAADSANDATEP